MGTSFGVGNTGEYHMGNHYDFLDKLLILPPEYHDDSCGYTSGLKSLYGLKGFEAVPVIKDFFRKCRHYQLHEGDRTLEQDFGVDVVHSCLINLAMLMADCIEKPYEEVHTA